MDGTAGSHTGLRVGGVRFGMVLATIIRLLAATMITGVILATPPMTWIMLAAIAASTARTMLSMQTLRPVLTR